MRQVLLLGIDITRFVISISEITNSAGDFGQLSINEAPSFEGDNRLGFWDVGNPASPFFGENNLNKFDVEIFNNGQSVFKGFVQNITANNQARISSIVLSSVIQKTLEKGLIFASADTANPAIIASQICSLYKIPIDEISFSKSSGEYGKNLIVFSAFFKGETSILDGLQMIAELGLARIYNFNNRLHYDFFTIKSADPIATFSDNSSGEVRIHSHPETEIIEKDNAEGYSVEWVGDVSGTKATFGIAENEGKTLSAGWGSPVRIMSLQSAVFVGEQWLAYLNKLHRKLLFDIPINFAKTLSLNDPIAINYRGILTTGDIISIDSSRRVSATVQILTR